MNSPHYLIEACVDSLSDAQHAAANNAHRIELCSRLDLDGLSPSIDLVRAVMDSVPIPIHVMVRPRPGDFCYAPGEIDQMITEITRLKELNVPGVVFGVLTSEQEIDTNQTARLARHAAPLKVTFHKAFDMCPDQVRALSTLMEIPEITCVLTSGGRPTAEEGLPVLQQLIEKSAGRIEIIAAGKVTHENLPSLHHRLHATAYHGKKIV